MGTLSTMTPGDWGRVLSLPLSFAAAILAVFIIRYWTRARMIAATQEGAIDTRAYRTPPHQHVIDFNRSNLLVLKDGALLAQCAMQGCDITVTIGRGVTELLIEDQEASI